MLTRRLSPVARFRPGASLVLVAVALTVIATLVVRAPEPDLAPTWTERTTAMEFTLIQSGTFRMGTPLDEPFREPGEMPHEVRISRPFYLGRHEVTQDQWTRVMGGNPSAFQDCGPRCPVEQVSYLAVQDFLERLNNLAGPGFRLPTEAEWEYACRAGGDLPFGHTSSLSSRDANINGNYPYNAPVGGFRKKPTPVGYFPPNAWGLFDMSGNVWEWVQDWHCPYPEGTVADPVGRCESPHRVIRGGSWLFDGASARCGLRYTHRPQDDGYSLGFRVARDPAR